MQTNLQNYIGFTELRHKLCPHDCLYFVALRIYLALKLKCLIVGIFRTLMYLFLAIEQTYWVIKMFASHKGVFDDF